MRLRWTAVAILVLGLAACTSDSNSAEEVAQPSASPAPAETRSVPYTSGTPVPSLPPYFFDLRYSRMISLTLHGDGTYELTTEVGDDSGEYVYRPAAGVLRLKSKGGELCKRGDVSRRTVLLDPHPALDATRLLVEVEREDCPMRGEFPPSLYIDGSAPEDLAGTWTLEVNIDFGPGDSYTIDTPWGRDLGTYVYDHPHQITLTTGGGDACELGSTNRAEAGRMPLNTFGSTILDFDPSDECFLRSVLTGAFMEIR